MYVCSLRALQPTDSPSVKFSRVQTLSCYFARVSRHLRSQIDGFTSVQMMLDCEKFLCARRNGTLCIRNVFFFPPPLTALCRQI